MEKKELQQVTKAAKAALAAGQVEKILSMLEPLTDSEQAVVLAAIQPKVADKASSKKASSEKASSEKASAGKETVPGSMVLQPFFPGMRGFLDGKSPQKVDELKNRAEYLGYKHISPLPLEYFPKRAGKGGQEAAYGHVFTGAFCGDGSGRFIVFKTEIGNSTDGTVLLYDTLTQQPFQLGAIVSKSPRGKEWTAARAAGDTETASNIKAEWFDKLQTKVPATINGILATEKLAATFTKKAE